MDALLKHLGLAQDVLTPDKHRLDDEFERHPADIARVAEAIAQKRLEVDDAKLDLARTANRLRDEFPMSAKKPTVADIKAAIEADPEYRKPAKLMNQLERELEEMQGVLKALEAKTSALKHLSELWQAGYYTTSSSRGRRDDDTHLPKRRSTNG